MSSYRQKQCGLKYEMLEKEGSEIQAFEFRSSKAAVWGGRHESITLMAGGLEEAMQRSWEQDSGCFHLTWSL